MGFVVIFNIWRVNMDICKICKKEISYDISECNECGGAVEKKNL